MDTSDDYRVMCKEADEIQDGHEWIDGDWYYDEKHWSAPRQVWFCADDEFYSEISSSEAVWLPDQTQLQGMLEGDWSLLRETYLGIARYFAKTYRDGFRQGTTPEQALIHLVMCQKTGKTWDGETRKWVSPKPDEIG